jgi:hypothetical protein
MAGSNARIKGAYFDYVNQARAYAAAAATELGMEEPTLIAERFGRLYYSHCRQGPDLLQAPELMAEVSQQFVEYVEELVELGLTNPLPVAQVNRREEVLALAAQPDGVSIINFFSYRARGMPVLESKSAYEIEAIRIRNHLQGRPISKPLLRSLAVNRSGTVEERNALVDAHLDKLDAAEARFGDSAQMDKTAWAYFKAHYFTDPEVAIGAYIDRHRLMKQLAADDPDIDDQVARNICLGNTDISEYPRLIDEFKVFLASVRETVAMLDICPVDEDVLRSVAAHPYKYSTPTGFALRAVRRQQMKNQGIFIKKPW